MQIERLVVVKAVIGLEGQLSSRQVKDMRCVVLCGSKGHAATGRTHLSSLNGNVFDFILENIGSIPKNAKLRPV